ncbi:hypothetical protein D1BOALGB6SA_5630 [Olavius sp. associated proteobacterium Delta 1]|nr:hypothetical protein D1BOALGB6SA_5630 [Olavius sp. associated proteobacterium Delta 1]
MVIVICLVFVFCYLRFLLLTPETISYSQHAIRENALGVYYRLLPGV